MKANLVRTETIWGNKKKYIYACTKCGSEFWRYQCSDRINPLCCNCKREVEKVRNKELAEIRQAKHDAEVRNKAIDEYKELIIARIQSKNRGLYVIEAMEIAEILKGGD